MIKESLLGKELRTLDNLPVTEEQGKKRNWIRSGNTILNSVHGNSKQVSLPIEPKLNTSIAIHQLHQLHQIFTDLKQEEAPELLKLLAHDPQILDMLLTGLSGTDSCNSAKAWQALTELMLIVDQTKDTSYQYRADIIRKRLAHDALYIKFSNLYNEFFGRYAIQAKSASDFWNLVKQGGPTIIATLPQHEALWYAFVERLLGRSTTLAEQETVLDELFAYPTLAQKLIELFADVIATDDELQRKAKEKDLDSSRAADAQKVASGQLKKGTFLNFILHRISDASYRVPPEDEAYNVVWTRSTQQSNGQPLITTVQATRNSWMNRIKSLIRDWLSSKGLYFLANKIRVVTYVPEAVPTFQKNAKLKQPQIGSQKQLTAQEKLHQLEVETRKKLEQDELAAESRRQENRLQRQIKHEQSRKEKLARQDRELTQQQLRDEQRRLVEQQKQEEQQNREKQAQSPEISTKSTKQLVYPKLNQEWQQFKSVSAPLKQSTVIKDVNLPSLRLPTVSMAQSPQSQWLQLSNAPNAVRTFNGEKFIGLDQKSIEFLWIKLEGIGLNNKNLASMLKPNSNSNNAIVTLGVNLDREMQQTLQNVWQFYQSAMKNNPESNTVIWVNAVVVENFLSILQTLQHLDNNAKSAQSIENASLPKSILPAPNSFSVTSQSDELLPTVVHSTAPVSKLSEGIPPQEIPLVREEQKSRQQVEKKPQYPREQWKDALLPIIKAVQDLKKEAWGLPFNRPISIGASENSATICVLSSDTTGDLWIKIRWDALPNQPVLLQWQEVQQLLIVNPENYLGHLLTPGPFIVSETSELPKSLSTHQGSFAQTDGDSLSGDSMNNTEFEVKDRSLASDGLDDTQGQGNEVTQTGDSFDETQTKVKNVMPHQLIGGDVQQNNSSDGLDQSLVRIAQVPQSLSGDSLNERQEQVGDVQQNNSSGSLNQTQPKIKGSSIDSFSSDLESTPCDHVSDPKTSSHSSLNQTQGRVENGSEDLSDPIEQELLERSQKFKEELKKKALQRDLQKEIALERLNIALMTAFKLFNGTAPVQSMSQNSVQSSPQSSKTPLPEPEYPNGKPVSPILEKKGSFEKRVSNLEKTLKEWFEKEPTGYQLFIAFLKNNNTLTERSKKKQLKKLVEEYMFMNKMDKAPDDIEQILTKFIKSHNKETEQSAFNPLDYYKSQKKSPNNSERYRSSFFPNPPRGEKDKTSSPDKSSSGNSPKL